MITIAHSHAKFMRNQTGDREHESTCHWLNIVWEWEWDREREQIQHSIDHRPLTFSHIASIQFQLDWFANDDVNNRNVLSSGCKRNTTHFISQLDCDWIHVITLIRFLVHITSIVVILITKANYCNNRINTRLSAFWYRFRAINFNARIALDWIDLTSFSSVGKKIQFISWNQLTNCD